LEAVLRLQKTRLFRLLTNGTITNEGKMLEVCCKREASTVKNRGPENYLLRFFLFVFSQVGGNLFI
jgi:hypothetical protein